MFVNLEIIFNNTYGFNQFTYKVPDKYADNIQVGDIVTVPFRNTTRNAIITEVNLATSSVSNTKTLFKKIGSINRNQYKYLERLAVSNNLNIGILLDKHISYELLSKQNKVKTNNIFIKPNSDVAIYLKESYNIIFTSSLEESKQVAEHLKNNGKKVSFYQKTGGVKEFTSFWEKNKEFETIIVLSVNFERINVDDKLTFHFFNSNNISYNLPKLNNLNIIESSLIKHKVFNGSFYYYNEFPSLEYFSNVNEYFLEIPEIDITYIYGNSLDECLEIFDLKYQDKDLTIFSYVQDLQFISKNHNLTTDPKNVAITSAILYNPTISFNGILSSNRLISFIRNITRFHKKNIAIVIFTTKKIDLITKLKSKQLSKWAEKEARERAKYGPNLNIRIYKITSKINLDFVNSNKYIIGPKITNNQYVYEVKIKLTDNINYNEIINLFKKLNKSTVERVKSL